MARISSVSDTIIVLPSVAGVGDLADVQLLALQSELGAARRRVDASSAVIACEIARRSDRALGQQGLAARTGQSSPEKVIQKLTGVSFSDARAMITAGTALDSVHSGNAGWLTTVAGAVTDGTLSVAGAAAIMTGLGKPSETVTGADLGVVATVLVSRAGASTGIGAAAPEDIAKAARTARAQLDLGSVADLEAHRLSKRSLTWFQNSDGMTRLSALLDP
ncbi:DUF222 domain-containing protein, partial [Salinibacterium sp.]|uniref:DUF222 domain-containing protein n=1 Tax=Salinibacterium sp. TaxID=1915057 RepID=UPI00286CC774